MSDPVSVAMIGVAGAAVGAVAAVVASPRTNPPRPTPMKPPVLLPGLILVLALACPGALAQTPPADWVDPATGHRVIRLSGGGGGSSLYFHQNAYTPKGDKLVFDTKDGIAAVDLTRLGKGPVKAEVVVPGARAISTAWRTPDVYYRKAGALYATNLDTKVERKVATTRGTVVNADETLVVGFENDPDAPAKVKELGLPMLVTTDLVRRDEPPGRLRPGGRSLAMVVTDVRSGAARKVHYSTEWLNHLQASPADPDRLLFCHEGAWHQVDRVWTIRADGTGLRLLHKRTMLYEIAGHEFFGHDGKWVWYDLQTPRSKEFWLAGVNIETGERIRYPVAREHWSVHFNVSRDGTLFAGDGGGQGSVANLTPLPERKTLDPPGNGQWIYLFTPAGAAGSIKVGDEAVKAGKLTVERLVDLSKHDYRLEPNVTITPDNRWVVFRSNMHGPTHVYAVEVAKSR
jgi:oligogalacturonide lyase